MKRPISLLISFLGLLAIANAQTLQEYLKLRKHYGITQAAGEEALETFVGSRVVEIQGVVKGTMKVSTGATSILLEKSNGDTMFVSCQSNPPDWLSGNETRVRLIVRADRPTTSDDITAELLGAASENEIAKIEDAPTTRHPGLSSRHDFVPRGSMARTATASEAVPIYAAFIRGRNRRLTEGESTRIAEGVIGYSVRYGVDARLIMAMVMVESGFNPHATSSKGAMGLGQLMPGTAAGMGVSNAYDSIENLYGTVRLIRGHLDNYQRQTGDGYDSLVLALAAYNAGAGAVKRHGGVPPYQQTQNYVRKVIAIYRALCGA